MPSSVDRGTRRIVRRVGLPSPAMVVALLALFVAIGGTTYAAVIVPAHSVGTKQLKNGAVATRKLKNGAVTGSKIKNGAVGKNKLNLIGVTVPSAVNANHASTADTATNANSAVNANHARTANTAADADALGGQAPAAYRDQCSLLNEVAGSTTAAGGECFEANERAPDTYWNAILTCAAAGGHLPTVGELAMYALQDPIPNHDIPFEEWVDSAYFASIDTGGSATAAAPAYYALIFSTNKIGNIKVDHEPVTASFPFRCAGGETN